ncbi:MAG: lipid A 3-O-deacylase [Gammaproteobacteria bacterium]|jgi:lipid A 3-O-deacylase
MRLDEIVKFLDAGLRCTLLVSALLAVATNTLAVESAKSPASSSTFSVLFENDLFGDTDQQYTNGVQLSWESPDLTRYADAERLPEWLLPIVTNLPWINEPDTQRNVGFSVGQKMFTPNNTQSSKLVADDRPYAGWLYGALGFTSKTAKRMDRFEFEFGVIGPAAQGEEAQNFIHDLRDLAKTRGWSHQLRNEPGFALIYERKWRPYASTNANGFGYDIITHAGGALGNVYVYANAGAETRIGWNLPGDFGTSYIRPGGNSNAPTTVNDPRMRGSRACGAYVFAALTGRVVGRDIFLDGNTFANSHDVSKKNFVGDFIVGGSLVFYRYKLSYAQVFRSREFDRQRDKPNFGSISLSVTF